MMAHQGTRSSVDQLATETLALVFMIGASTRTELPETLPISSSFPALVSHVCRRWRSVALETSQLWTTIFVHERFALPRVNDRVPGDASLHRTTDHLKIKAFLERSKAKPLTIYLDMRSPSWDFNHTELEHPFKCEHVSLLMDTLLPHLDRWEDVEILSDTWSPLAVISERCRAGLREFGRSALVLRRLSLSRCNPFFALEGSQFFPAGSGPFLAPFEHAPLLRVVMLSGVHINWGRHFMHNLTELSLKYHAQEVLPSASELVNIINSSPALEHLSILGWGVCSFNENVDMVELEGRIFIRNIKQLTIGWVNICHALRLLSLFTWYTPRLCSITLEDIANCLDPISTQDSSDIINFISDRLSGGENTSFASSEIVELTLRSVLLSTDSLSRFMGAVPKLQNLTLHNIDGTLFSVLNPVRGGTGHGTILCPNLSYILVRTAGHVPNVELEAIVQARREVARDHSKPHIVLEIEDFLASFKESGLLEQKPQEDIDTTHHGLNIDILQDFYDSDESEDNHSNEKAFMDAPLTYDNFYERSYFEGPDWSG